MKKALVLSLVFVLGLGVASLGQTLSGLWNTTVTIVPTPISLTLVSQLKVTYAVSGWSFTSDSLISNAGWTLQTFDASGALGAFTIGSKLIFDPQFPAMIEWVVNGGVSLAGVTFDGTFVSVPGDTAFIIGASGSAGLVDVSVDLKLGTAWYDEDGIGAWYGANYNYLQAWYAAAQNGDGCGFDFNGVVIDVSFPFCCAEVNAELAFTCLGFDYAEFGVTDIAIPNLPWLSLDATVHFEVGAKTLILTPVFDFGAVTCFNLYISQYGNYDNDPYSDTYGQYVISPGHPLLLQDFAVNGISLVCDIGGVQFTGISFWGVVADNFQKPGLLFGTSYWEAYRIKTTDDGCCGPFSFDVTVYFSDAGTKLFDLAEMRANMSIQVATQFTFSTGIRYSTQLSTFTRWTIGLKVVW